MPTVQANADGSYTITVPAPAAPVVAATPTITEVDVKESDGSEVITAPEAPLPPAPTA